MGSSTRDREGNFRLICGRNEMDALIGYLWSMAVRSALPSSLFWQRFFLMG